jgi:hypothetical protein
VPAPSPTLRALSSAVAAGCGIERGPAPVGGVDDRELAALATRHRVAGLAYRGARVLPSSARAALRPLAQREAVLSLHVAAVQQRVLASLHEARVDVVVLKGLPLAAQAYGDPGARAPGDVDVLVRGAQAEAAVDALLDAGFAFYGWRRPDDPDRPAPGRAAVGRLERLPMLRDVKLVRDGVLVEVHWRLFDNPRLMPVDPSWLDAPHDVAVHGAATPTLDPAVHLAYVLVHGSPHLWSQLKWVADVAALATTHPAAARPHALRAASPGNERSLATGLRVAEAAFGPFLPPETRAWAQAVPGTGLIVRRALGALKAPDDRPKVVTPRTLVAEAATRLMLRTDAPYRRDELRLLLLAAGRAHHVEDPGPRELASGPARWARRAVRRRSQPARPPVRFG